MFPNNAKLFLSLIDSLKGYPLQTDAMAAYLDARVKPLIAIRLVKK